MARGEITHHRGAAKQQNGEKQDGDDPAESEANGTTQDSGGYAPSVDDMADAAAIVDELTATAEAPPDVPEDIDPAETQEWLDSLRYVLESKGPERVSYLLSVLDERAHRAGVE